MRVLNPCCPTTRALKNSYTMNVQLSLEYYNYYVIIPYKYEELINKLSC